MYKKIISILVLIIFILFNIIELYSYALTPYEGIVENPVLQEVTTNSITLIPFDGYEYSKDGMIWQDSNVFNNLTVATTYEIYQRVKATEEIDHSDKSEALEVATKKNENNSIPYTPSLYNRTDTSISLNSYVGYEYSIGGEIWQDSRTFTNLTSNTGYTFYQRIKETSDTYASKISNSEIIYTLKKNNSIEPAEIQAEEITPTSITLISIDGYEYSMDGVNFQDNNYFWGLTPNTEYTFYQRIKETEEYLAGSISTKKIKTIKYLNNNSIDAPVLVSNSSNEVILKKIDVLEYSKDQENWQDSSVFASLMPETNYTFYQRIKETEDTYASDISEGLNVKTKKENTIKPTNPEIENITENIVTLKYVEGYEYSVDGGKSWQDSNVFSKLDPVTEYSFVQRIKANEQYGFSSISEEIIVKTEHILSSANIPDDYIPIYTADDIPKGFFFGIDYTDLEYEEAINKLKLKYILMNDIELSEANDDYLISVYPFEGVFDGNGYSLKNARGLFDANYGLVKNLYMESYSFNDLYTGCITRSNQGQIINCHNKGEISIDEGSLTGIACGNSGIIKNCSNEAKLSCNKGDVSGICGSNDGTIEKCYNVADLTSATNEESIKYGTAGISSGNGNTGIIKSCYNIGNITTGKGSIAGGIVASNYNTISNCYNQGTVKGNEEIGGICGFNSEEGLIEFCHNIGRVNAEMFGGGITGFNAGIITMGYNSGTINTTHESGGIVGRNEKTIKRCYNIGTVYGECSIGGIGINNNNGIIEDCYNTGYLTTNYTTNYGKDIAGIASGGSIKNCYNIGLINDKVSSSRRNRLWRNNQQLLFII